jgi:tRNA(Glu) U13 pseudouridine synthase TruD
VRTHEIGKENLHQNWIKVIHLILSQHPDGDDYQADRKKQMIKYVFEEGNIEDAIKLLEKRDVGEVQAKAYLIFRDWKKLF